MNKLIISGVFLVGALCGALAYKIYVDKKIIKTYDAMIEAELEHMREILKNELDKKNGTGGELSFIAEEEVEDKTNVEEDPYYDYTSHTRNKRDDVPPDDSPREYIKDGIEIVCEADTKDDMYSHYDDLSFTYYSDGVLVDEADVVVDDVDYRVGKGSLDKFGWNDEDPDTIYVINHNISAVIEINKFYCSYADMYCRSDQ